MTTQRTPMADAARCDGNRSALRFSSYYRARRQGWQQAIQSTAFQAKGDGADMNRQPA